MPTAFFIVRATVADPGKRKAFDAWYSREGHLPDATKSFWRFEGVAVLECDRSEPASGDVSIRR